MGNKLKEEIQEEQQTKKQRAEKRAKVVRPIVNVLSGDFLAEENVLKHLPYMLFLVLLTLVYIGNGYVAEGSVRKINKIKGELKELRSEYITTHSDLMYTTKQSELVNIINERELGLQESVDPPKKIEITQEEWEEYGE